MDQRHSVAGEPVDFQAECVEFFGRIVLVIGVPRSVGQIYGVLFAARQPLSFSDIVAELGISKGSASQGLQFLRTLGAVREVSTAKDSRELFVPELGLRKLFGGVLREKIEPLVNSGDDTMRRLRQSAENAPDAATTDLYLSRVSEIQTWRRQVGFLLPLLKTLLRSRHG